jgi:hypothetical protein
MSLRVPHRNVEEAPLLDGYVFVLGAREQTRKRTERRGFVGAGPSARLFGRKGWIKAKGALFGNDDFYGRNSFARYST